MSHAAIYCAIYVTPRNMHMGQAARAVDARGLSTREDGQAVATLLKAVDPAQDGKHPERVNGQPAVQSGNDGRTAGSPPVHAFAQPAVVFDTPSSTLAASSASFVGFAGQAISVVAQGDMQQTAAYTSTQVSGQTSSVYAHQGGIATMAANGPVSLRAHTDALKVLADQSVTITSVNDEIRISANQEIQLVAGQSAITLKDGNIDIVTPGAFTVHGATHGFEAGASQAATLPALPDSRAKLFDEAFVLTDKKTGNPIPNMPYRIKLPDGSYQQGVTDDQGRTHVVNGVDSGSIELYV